MESFTRNKYNAGTQNWAVVADDKNRLYIANNEGLLIYNGTDWQLYPVPNKTILRSLAFGPGGKLYAGAQDELGYFAPDGVGRLRFTSLKPLLPQQYQSFPDVWQLVEADGQVFFRTDARIFRLAGEKMSVYPATEAWLSMHRYGRQVLAHAKGKGLLLFKEDQWQTFIAEQSLPPGFFITGIIPFGKDTSLVSTIRNGLYLLTKDVLTPFTIRTASINTTQHFTSLTLLNDGSFMAGTYFNGIYHISRQGDVLDNFSTRNGMPNNTIRCLYADGYSNAWAGLDNGLALISYNNAIKQINPAAFNNGAGYDVKAFNGDLYFALSTGLQWVPVKEQAADLSAIPDEPRTIIGGLTWNLSVINDQLISGRDDGLYVIDKYMARPVSQSTGYWNGRALPSSSSQQFVAGNYLGLHFFETGTGGFQDAGKLENFSESSRYIETETNTIWVSHPYRGIFSIRLPGKEVKLFSEKDGLPAILDNHVFKIKGKIVFATSKGIYEYEAASGRFIKSPAYDSLFGDRPIRYLKEDEKGNIWFVQDKMTGVADYSGSQPVIHYIPELKSKILSGFENIFPYDTRNILLGGETGFYHLNYEKYKDGIKPFAAYVTQVKTTGIRDSILFGGYAFDSTSLPGRITVPYRLNSLHFSYAASVYGQHSGLEFSYYLQGFDADWSNWSSNTEKEYTNLPAGDYIFSIKSRKSPSHESAVYQYSFTIRPPWYQTIWAYGLYLLLLAVFLYALLKYQARRHRKKQEARREADRKKFVEEQKQMAYQHQLELAKSEKELIRLQNEKLEAEITYKNAELASATMNLVQKKEFILKLKTELQQLQKNAKVGDDNPELKKLLKVLAEEEKLDDEWNSFSQHFNSVHGDFLTILKNKFPALKPHELRLCAYLRMNLSSKEIAPLMSISVRGVEISRYRLRKKLALPTEANLVQYLLELKEEKDGNRKPEGS